MSIDYQEWLMDMEQDGCSEEEIEHMLEWGQYQAECVADLMEEDEDG